MEDIEQNLKNKRILVTGASGFIGSRLVKALLDCGAGVIAHVDSGSKLTRLSPVASNPNIRLIRCSLADSRSATALIKKAGEIDLVAHLALRVPENNSFCGQCKHEIEQNLMPTINLLQAFDRAPQGFCFASSVSVYGVPENLPVSENDRAAPISGYGVTKLAIEHYLRAWGESLKVPVTILRYSTVYGPGETGHRAIPNFIEALSQGLPPSINGDGSETRDYVYIDDVIGATVLALAKRPASILNIGSGRGYPSLQIARDIIRLYPANIEPAVLSHNGHKINIACDITAATRTLGYFPRMSLENGLIEEIDWYRKNISHSAQPTMNGSWKIKKQINPHIYPQLKSALERLIALLAIVALSPVLAVIAIGIRIESAGNPVFAQERVGKDGRKFKAYKFRSMPSNNDDSEYKTYLRKYVLENAPYRVDANGQRVYKCDTVKITRLGAVLRKTNLDELPQLFNILKGEMSFIGPRPDVPFAVAMYKDWHRKRLESKPGITGLWQVCGRKNLSFEDMVRLDVDYISRESPLLDAKILVKTLGVVLKRDGS